MTPNNTVAGLAEKLLSCPFCGGSEIEVDEDLLTYISCKHCEVLMRGHISKSEATAAWNRRASHAPSASVGVAEVVRLRQALEKLMSYNMDIRDGKINYRAQDHIDVAAAALQHPAAPSVSPSYDRELIAQFLEATLRGEQHRFQFTAMSEQARLLREADNAEAANIRTVNRSPSVEGDAGELPEAVAWCDKAMLAKFVSGNSYVLSCATKTAAWFGDISGLYTADQMRAYGEQCRCLAIAEQPGSAVQGAISSEMIEQLRADATTLANHWDERMGEAISAEESDALVKRLYALWEKLTTTPPPAPAAEQGDGDCAKCGAPTDPDCGHVGECKPEVRGVEGMVEQKDCPKCTQAWYQRGVIYRECLCGKYAATGGYSAAAPSGVRVDDAMVERAIEATAGGYVVRDCWLAGDKWARELMRAALTAALAGKEGE